LTFSCVGINMGLQDAAVVTVNNLHWSLSARNTTSRFLVICGVGIGMGGDSGPTAWENLGGSGNSVHKCYKKSLNIIKEVIRLTGTSIITRIACSNSKDEFNL